MFKVIIAGGRDFKDYEYLKETCLKILKNKTDIEVVCGEAPGADKLGAKLAKEMKWGLAKFPAPWGDIEGKPSYQIGIRNNGEKYWKGAGHYRNGQMADYGDALICFWDGVSTGTKNMITQARDKKLLIRIKKY